MERTKLRTARAKKHWTLEKAAEAIGVGVTTLHQWEKGRAMPHPFNKERLCEVYGTTAAELDLEDAIETSKEVVGKSAEDLDFIKGTQKLASSQSDAKSSPAPKNNDPAFPSSLSQQDIQNILPLFSQTVSQGIMEAVKSLGSQDSNELYRKILETTSGIVVGGAPVDHIPFLEPETSLMRSIAPEEFLPQCANSLRACWHLLHNKGITIASELIATYMPTLMALTLSSSKYQETAASLATQAKILQAVLAMHRSDVSAREMHCLEAVRYGQLSDDRGLLAAALMYVGYTYTYCMPKPKKAIIYYKEAIQTLGNEISLLRSDIYIGLADAYAKVKDEQKVLESITFAQDHFPLYPEQDSRFLYADCKWSELYQWEGKAYLDLAQHYPSSDYYKKAFEAFTRSAEVQSVGDLSTSETMLNQAEVARGLDDLERYESCLREGTLKGLAAGSQKRYNEAYSIFQQTPKKWLSEKRIHDVAVEVFHSEQKGYKQ